MGISKSWILPPQLFQVESAKLLLAVFSNPSGPSPWLSFLIIPGHVDVVQPKEKKRIKSYRVFQKEIGPPSWPFLTKNGQVKFRLLKPWQNKKDWTFVGMIKTRKKQNSDNLQYNTVGRWVHGRIVLPFHGQRFDRLGIIRWDSGLLTWS